jgi:hypothetical protein
VLSLLVDGDVLRGLPMLQVTFDSLESVNVLPCGHVMHSSCFKAYVRHQYASLFLLLLPQGCLVLTGL